MLEPLLLRAVTACATKMIFCVSSSYDQNGCSVLLHVKDSQNLLCFCLVIFKRRTLWKVRIGTENYDDVPRHSEVTQYAVFFLPCMFIRRRR
jgi:hypothetical protein